MTANPYTPDETELADCYAMHMRDNAGESIETARADARRGIARIKAEALREAADDLLHNPPSTDAFGKTRPGHTEAQRRLLILADRIEKENER